MALVMTKRYGPAIIDVYDDCYKGVTVEQAEKILEDMYNSTSIVKKSGGYVTTHYCGKQKDPEGEGSA